MSFMIQTFNKTATRLAEAQWVTFTPPNITSEGWRLRGFRTGLEDAMYADIGVDPLRVVAHGATHLHSLGPFATIEHNSSNTVLTSLDAPIVSVGMLSPFPTPGNNTIINPAQGMHFNIQNNIWNVNFPQWYPFVPKDKDAKFRFYVVL